MTTRVQERAFRFQASREAIGRIRNAKLRRDFLNMVVGAERAMRIGNRKLGRWCLQHLLDVAFTLNRTISPATAGKITEAVRHDAAPLKLRLGEIKDDSECKRGWPNPATCQYKKDSQCDKRHDGCATVNPSGDWSFIFSWPAV
jgi:hypothetical protein